MNKRYNRRRSKKGQVVELKDILLVVVGAVILFFVVMMIVDYFSSKDKIEICRTSVVLQSKTRITLNPVKGAKSPFNIQCDKRYLYLSDKELKVGYSPDSTDHTPIIMKGTLLDKWKALTPDIVNQVAAQEMKTCYYMFGNGNLNVFDSDLSASGVGNSMFNGNNVCFVCAEIRFSGFDKNNPKVYSGLMDYIKGNKIPNTELTYFDYFNQSTVNQVPWDVFLGTVDFQGDTKFNTADTYSVIFTKQDKRLKTYASSLAKTVLCTNPLALGLCHYFNVQTVDQLKSSDINNNYYVYIVPSEPATELNKLCDLQP